MNECYFNDLRLCNLAASQLFTVRQPSTTLSLITRADEKEVSRKGLSGGAEQDGLEDVTGSQTIARLIGSQIFETC